LKASSEIKRPASLEYRPFIILYMEIVDELHVIPFIREQMPDKDIALDFATRFLPDCFEEIKACAGEIVNETISAEAMSILFSYRRNCHPQQNGIHTPGTRALLGILRQCERQAGLYTRPTLRSEIASAIETHCEDLVWLRESFGIAFDRLKGSPSTAVPKTAFRCVEDVCVVDGAKREQLLMLTVNKLLALQEQTSYFRVAHPLVRWLQLNMPTSYYKIIDLLK
jgi:hypothetical protein